MKFSTLIIATATLTAASFAQADESVFAPKPMSMKSRAEVRAEAVGTPVRGDVGFTFVDSRQTAGMSTLTRDDVRASARAKDARRSSTVTPELLGSVGGM